MCGLALATSAAAQNHRFDIPSGDLKTALDAYAQQSGVRLIYLSDDVKGSRSGGASGEMSEEDALDHLLQGTGFIVRRDQTGAIAVVRRGDAALEEAPRSPKQSEASARTMDYAGIANTSYAQATQTKDAPTPTSEAAANQAPRDAAEPDGAVTLDAVRVTGTRIYRAGFDTLEPATVVTRQAIEARGLTNVADALNEMPGFGVGVTPEGQQSAFGVAVNFVDRFGLGSQRTLTLINGRRVVSSNTPTVFGPGAPGLQVDLNVIPVQLIDRVENLAIGGAPTYGSDAIAGVVNIITRRDYEGAEVNATTSITERGDSLRYNIGAIFGQNIADDRGNVTVSVAYDKVDGILATDRQRFRQGWAFLTNPCADVMAQTQPGRTPGNDGRFNPNVPFQTCSPNAASDGIPNAVLARNARFFTGSFGGLLLPATGAINLADGRLRGFSPAGTTYLQFDSSGNVVPYNPGINFGPGDASGGDGYDFNEVRQLSSDMERRTGNLLASWHLTDHTRLFFEGMLYQGEGRELIDWPINNLAVIGNNQSGPLTIGNDYPLLSDQNRAVLAANGITSFRLSRTSRDLLTRNANSQTNIVRGVFGIDGTFDLAGTVFNWEVTANLGRNEAKFFQTVLNQQNFINALNVTRLPNGQIVCSTTPTPGLIVPGGGAPIADPNCVPLNLLGEGRASLAARDYVTGRTQTDTALEQQVFNANLGGSLFELWGGPLSFNAGLERRIERGSFNPDEFQQRGLGREVAFLPMQGSFATKEIFVEVFAPLVDSDANLPLLNRFDLTAKYRRVDNTVNGVFNTYTYGFQWEPIEDFEFRGNFTRSLRAPSITELFTPRISTAAHVPDPCDARNVGGGTRPATRMANCTAFYQAFGIVDGASTFITLQDAGVTGTISGDPNLLNESSDAQTLGLVWQPSFVDGLRATIDWYKIDITNVIGNLGIVPILSGCYDNTDFNVADPRNANQFCSRITRDADGQIQSFRSGFVNGGFLNFTGWSGEVQYIKNLAEWGFTPGGNLAIGFNASRLDRLESSLNNVVTNNEVGEINNPKNQYRLSLGYQRERWGVNVQTNYTSSVIADNDFSPEARDILVFDSYTSLNAGVNWEFIDDAILRLAVTNITDVEPPFPLGRPEMGGIGAYDILGRRYALSLNWKF